MSKSMEFLKATGGDGWKTLEALVADLDRAGYWKGESERSPTEKRRHVRKMLATLVFRGAASRRPRTSDGPPLAQRHVFVSTMKANDRGESVRVYKQFFNLTFEEMCNVLEDEEANHAYRTRRTAQGRGLAEAYLEGDEEADAGARLLEEITEGTMRRAWPGVGPAARRQIVLAASIQHRHSEETLRVVSERCRAEGFDIEKLMDEYLRTTEVSPVVDPQEANEIARSATEYFKVVGELEGSNFRRMCFEALMEARTSTVEEFAEREGMDFKEAAVLFAGQLGEYADEFQSVLEIYRRDNFGWTLDEHLQFAIERRGEGAHEES
ncbi:MAG TPA: hypothetical protein VE225_00145 [Rubrobacteraceae bacterium]|nr:hypothetical protein [Rubrobacteraceae bacterium]